MSKGLSRMQERIMEKMRERGFIDIFDVAKTYHRKWNEDHKIETFGPVGAYWTDVSSIAHIHPIYRMMRSLEDRGMVASLVHQRPKMWYLVMWIGGMPQIDISKGRAPLHIVKRKAIRYRTKGRVWQETFH